VQKSGAKRAVGFSIALWAQERPLGSQAEVQPDPLPPRAASCICGVDAALKARREGAL